MSIYDISKEYMQLLEMLESEEVTEEEIKYTLEAISSEFDQHADNIACIIKNLDAESYDISQEIENLNRRRKSKEKAAIRLKQFLLNSMVRIGKKTIETAKNKIQYRPSYSLRIDDEYSFIDSLSDEQRKEFTEDIVTTIIHKNKIKDAIKHGEKIDGAIIEEKYNIQIK